MVVLASLQELAPRECSLCEVAVFERAVAEFDGVPRNLPRNLGDVVIAHQIAAAEAARAKITLADHLSHLIVHGILHLLGYDHENDAEAGKMEGREIEILGALDIADPYT